MSKAATVFTIGEMLIDFIPNERGVPLKQVNAFQKAPGGAPANVACAVSRLGGTSAFIGKLGADAFGDFLLDTLINAGVNINYVSRTDQANTALAFVSLKADGDREFMFYRNPSADMLLSEDEIDSEWFSGKDILHFGSVDLIEAPVKYAHIKAINSIKSKGGLVSFDPNVRLALWDDAQLCRKTINDFIPYADILKISDEELEFITGIPEGPKAIASLFTGDVKIIMYTKGAHGAELYTRDINVSVPARKVEVVDTTGAGDAFMGAFLYKISQDPAGICFTTPDAAYEVLDFANKAASISVTRKGAISALPTLDEITSCID
ncbi:PfkB family carbohydrate kinase [Mahella sp.]|uniref:PfkB family carbohydrate kinase n=1 Tax=Mahella sp. TaxID=2798721 RepID=UPI0025C5CFA3|nr:PfkB family carbohydrate kinase [Mahella sp.]MBZ4665330.1 PfkB domain protein [Mahella sp.]